MSRQNQRIYPVNQPRAAFLFVVVADALHVLKDDFNSIFVHYNLYVSNQLLAWAMSLEFRLLQFFC